MVARRRRMKVTRNFWIGARAEIVVDTSDRHRRVAVRRGALVLDRAAL